MLASASGVRRSFPPLPCRTTISRRSKSMSLTRSRRHSSSRSPLPYIKTAQSFAAPDILLKHAANLVLAQHHRHAFRTAGRGHALEPCERPLQHTIVQERQRGERLILGRRRNAVLNRQVREKPLDVSFAEISWVPAIVEQDETSNPLNVGLFGPAAVAPLTQPPANDCQQAKLPVRIWRPVEMRKRSGWTHSARSVSAVRHRHQFSALVISPRVGAELRPTAARLPSPPPNAARSPTWWDQTAPATTARRSSHPNTAPSAAASRSRAARLPWPPSRRRTARNS